jgi:hypothetical protein
MALGNDPSELLNALDDASCLEAAVPDRRVGVVSTHWRPMSAPQSRVGGVEPLAGATVVHWLVATRRSQSRQAALRQVH